MAENSLVLLLLPLGLSVLLVTMFAWSLACAIIVSVAAAVVVLLLRFLLMSSFLCVPCRCSLLATAARCERDLMVLSGPELRSRGRAGHYSVINLSPNLQSDVNFKPFQELSQAAASV